MENKWWEYYTVRYFVGTVVGALLVAALNAEPGSPFEGRMEIIGDSKDNRESRTPTHPKDTESARECSGCPT